MSKNNTAAKAAGPASKAKPRAVSNPKKTAAKKKIDSDSEGESDSFNRVPTPPPRDTKPKRTARAQPKYVEIGSDNNDDDDDDAFTI